MAWSYYAAAEGITPVVNDPNIYLEQPANTFSQIYEINWGGEAIASTAMRTFVKRASPGSGPATAIVAGANELNQPASVVISNRGDHAAVKAVPSGGVLFSSSWNAHGGVVQWFANPGEELDMLGITIMIQEGQVGVGVSTYGWRWRES